jgi:hypothetical protein
MVLVAAGLIGLLAGLLLIAVSSEAEVAVPWALYLAGGLVAGLLLATVVSACLLLTLRPPSLPLVSGTTHELQTHPRRILQLGSGCNLRTFPRHSDTDPTLADHSGSQGCGIVSGSAWIRINLS